MPLNRLRFLMELRFAPAVIGVNILFSLVFIVALIVFIDDVASALTVYFELGDEEKWQIVTKFKTPIIMAVLGLILFNLGSVLVCLFYSRKIFVCLDNAIKQMDFILVGGEQELVIGGFSRQFSALGRKLEQLKVELKQKRVGNAAFTRDMATVAQYLHDLDKENGKPLRSVSLPTSPLVAERLNSLTEHFFAEKLDDAR